MPQSRSEAARINGAKSKGPITPEGRARSSRNSLRHGLCSSVVVLPHEDRGAFEALRDSYMDDFQPDNQSQHDLVETMAAARWRLNRHVEMEAKIFEEEVILRRKEMEKELIEMTEVEKLAWVFGHMANHGKGLHLLLRYESQLNRTYERALKQLQSLQKTHPPDSEVKVPNEPKLALVPPPPEPPKEPSEPVSTPSEPTPPQNSTPGGPIVPPTGDPTPMPTV